MNLFSILRFLRDFADDLIFIAIFVVVLFMFLKEFKLSSKNSWGVLLGFTALGGLFVFRAWRRKKLLEEFRQREKQLEELEKAYDDMKQKAKITEEAYKEAKAELQEAKVTAGLDLLKADQDLADKLEQIKRERQNMTAEESVAKIKEALQ